MDDYYINKPSPHPLSENLNRSPPSRGEGHLRKQGKKAQASPSLPIASTGQPSSASVHAAISSSVVGCLLT